MLGSRGRFLSGLYHEADMRLVLGDKGPPPGMRAIADGRNWAGVALERARVAKDDEPAPRARDRDVEPAPVAQEADRAARVRAHERDEDRVALRALERVDRAHARARPRGGGGLAQRAAHGVDLRAVERDDADVDDGRGAGRARGEVPRDARGANFSGGG